MDTVEITQLLSRWRDGEGDAFDRLLPLACDELRRTASASTDGR